MKNKIISIFLSKQFFIFLVVGGINTLNGLWIPSLLSVWLQANLAYVLSYIPSLAISYVLNSFFTFKDSQLTFEKYIKFNISYIPNFIIQNIVFFVVYNVCHANKFIGIILASAIGIPVTFLIMKFFTFSKPED